MIRSWWDGACSMCGEELLVVKGGGSIHFYLRSLINP